MSRSRVSAVLAGAVALGTLTLFPLAGTAVADPTFTPDATDVVGVGSDTSEFVLTNLADGTATVAGYNSGRATGRLVSWNATGTTPVSLREGHTAVTRPNGSGAGKATLYGAGNNVDVNFARSSSSLSTTEQGASLWQVPFAVDGLKMAVRSAGSNAPAFITPADVLAIYKGEKTTWNQVGGISTAAIHPLIPQTGSGTRSFFLAQLQALNGGTALTTFPASVHETQEHSDVDIKNDADALAPFSTGRAQSTATVAVLGGSGSGGFEALRALYDVVRQTDLAASWFGPIFGSAGFICSPAAKPLIEAAGFAQLATAANGGVCGEATQAASTNFTSTSTAVPARATTTALAATASAQTVTLRVTVTASGATPEGTVSYFEGATAVGGSTALSGGVGLLSKPGTTAGLHTYRAVFTPSSSAAFVGSASPEASVTVVAVAAKVASTTSVTMKKRFAPTDRVKAKIKVVRAGHPAAGKVRVFMGHKRIAKGKLVHGKLVVKLPHLKKGKHRLRFLYLGNSLTLPSKKVVRVKVIV